jgi:serine protease Do
MPSNNRTVMWVLTLLGGICLGAAAVGLSQQQESTSPTTLSILPASQPTYTPDEFSVAFREISERVLPAVVSLETEVKPREITRDQRRPSPLEERFFREFFGDDPRLEEFFGDRPQRTPRRQGAGSGFIVSDEGIILTNSHVVEGADSVRVRLYDGREIQADEWDFDPRSDVAIVRISVDEKLPFLTLGDSDQMEIGDWVLALGNPFQVGTTVTAGIISATGRGPGILEREGFLQTDAAINPGNSGGPLVNLHGEVIGINTAIATRTGSHGGIGFAIPSRMARWVAEQLIEHGEVKRSYLGVALQDLSQELREQLGVPFGQGALVADVRPDTPAQKAGVEPGDIILEFNDRKITDRDDLVDVVERSESGQPYDMIVQREGEKVTIQVTLEPMPADYTPALQRRLRGDRTPETIDPEEVESQRLGLEVAELDAELAEQLGVDEGVRGVVVRQVRPDTPAARAGLRAGDIIQRVGTRPIRTLNEFREAVRNVNLEERGLLLHIRRGEGSAFVVLKAD